MKHMGQKRNNPLEVIGAYLRNYNREYYVRELSRLLKIPLKNMQNTLISLEHNKILKSSMRGKNKYYCLNLNNIKTKFYLLQAEIHKTMLFLDKHPQIQLFLKELSTNNLVIIFGSFAKGTAEKNSDLDLLLATAHDEKLPYHLLPYKAHEIIIQKNSFKKAVFQEEPLIKEIEENHVILNDHSFYINTLWDHYGK